MLKLFAALSGYKTYLLVIAALVTEAAAWWSGDLTGQQALAAFFSTSSVAALRHGISGSVITIAEQLLPAVLKAVSEAQKTAVKAVLLCVVLASMVSACALTGDVNADMASFATEVQAYNADLQTKSAAFNSGLLTDAKVLGQAACGTGNELDGLFKAYTPVMLVAGVDPRVAATEAGAKVALDLSCAIVDKADPSTPAATINSAVAQAMQAVQTTQAALATGAPGLAAIVTAPLPAVTAPAAPATGPPAQS